jgi:hypothetical protein
MPQAGTFCGRSSAEPGWPAAAPPIPRARQRAIGHPQLVHEASPLSGTHSSSPFRPSSIPVNSYLVLMSLRPSQAKGERGNTSPLDSFSPSFASKHLSRSSESQTRTESCRKTSRAFRACFRSLWFSLASSPVWSRVETLDCR